MMTHLLQNKFRSIFQFSSKLLVFWLLFYPLNVSAQCPDNINVSSQEDLDQIISEFPNCQTLSGFLRLTGTVNNLAGLSNLQSVGRYVIISSQQVTSLSGLDNLQTIGEQLNIDAPVVDYTGLVSLLSIGGDFDYSSTSTSFAGLESLTEIGGDLVFSGTSLETLTGLEALTTVGGNLRFFVWNNVEVVEGLPNLTTIGGRLALNQCEQIKHFNALPKLETVEEGFSLGLSMPELETITGFQSLRSVGEVFSVQGVNKKTLDFPKLETVGANFLMYSDCFLNIPAIKSVGANFIFLGRDAEITGFDLLENVDGILTFAAWETPAIPTFASLKTIGNTLTIASTDSIESFDSFPVLETIGGDLIITKVKNGQRLKGFHKLHTVTGNFDISECDSFKLVEGFENLQTVGGDFDLNFNRSLNICDAFCDFIENGSVGGDISIFFNGQSGVSTCRYTQGIFLACPTRFVEHKWDANPEILKQKFPNIETASELTPEQILDLEVDRDALVADGSSQLILQMTFDAATNYQTNDAHFSHPWGNESVEINGIHYGFVLMTAPKIFDKSNSEIENGYLTAQYSISVTVGNGTLTDDISIFPPPVVLVHGTFADPSTWTKKVDGQMSMQEAIEAEGYKVFILDYKPSNGMSDPSSFSHNWDAVWRADLGGIAKAIQFYREDLNTAICQADVIGHSLGGVLPRVFASDHYNPIYRQPRNFMDGDINRLITIGSTHHGSHLGELQDFLAKGNPLQFGIPGFFAAQATNLIGGWVGGAPLTQAVINQVPENEALMNVGATDVPAHAITLRAPRGTLIDETYDVGDSYYNLYKYLALLVYYNGAITDEYLAHKLSLCERDLKAETTKNGELASEIFGELTDEQIFKEMFVNGVDRNADEFEAIDGEFTPPNNIELLSYLFGETEMEFTGTSDPMLNGFKPDQEPIGIPNSLFKNLVMPTPDELEPQESLLEAFRSLVFNHDDNDGVVRVESQSGELEKSCPECVSLIDSVLHSPAPQHPDVQAKVLELLNGGMDKFHEPGFPAAGQGQLLYYPPIKSTFYQVPVRGADAICASGMVASHGSQYARIADQENAIIMVRPVNADATPLIAKGAATKEMDVKPKSSNWGPQKGYLPVEQRYSKIWKVYEGTERDDKIDDYTAKSMENIQSGITTGRHLKIKACQQDYLVYIDRAKMTGNNDLNAADEIVLVPTFDMTMVCQWKEPFNSAEAISDCAPRTSDHDLDTFKVMATPRVQETDDETNRYLTADYDLLMMGFFEGENITYTKPEPIPLQPGVGAITPEQNALVTKLNKAVEDWTGYTGGDLTHHGPENQFGKSPYVDYPITVFMPDDRENGFFNGPKGQVLSINMGPPGFRDIHLKRLINRLRKRGYDLVDNPTAPGWHWTWNENIDGFELADSPLIGDYVDQLPKNNCDRSGAQLVSTCVNSEAGPSSEESFEEFLFGRSTFVDFEVKLKGNKIGGNWLELEIESLEERQRQVYVMSGVGAILNQQKLIIPSGSSSHVIDISNIGSGIFYLKVEGNRLIPFVKVE